MRTIYAIATTVEITIYALIEPGTEHSPDPYVRYIGQSSEGLRARLSAHIADAKAGRMGNEAFRDWILSCLRLRTRPVVVPVEVCTSHVSADMAERHHIDRCQRLYADLLNLRDNPQRTQSRPFTEPYLKRVF